MQSDIVIKGTANKMNKQMTAFHNFIKKLKRDKYLIILLIPAFAFYVIFCYTPMYGNIIAFKDFNPIKGIMRSPWIGLKWFEQFFSSVYFGRLLSNTILLNFYSLLWGFPIPIIFALVLNEIKDGPFKRITQTVSYLPHFISVVVVVGMLVNMLSSTGIITSLVYSLTGVELDFMRSPEWFRTVYIGSGIWQEFGWNSILYIAALSAINPELYEAARVDGASRFKQMIHITLPGLMPTISIILLLNIGGMLSIGFEKIILMYTPSTYETADVISTYVYRQGIQSMQYSFAAAVDLFNSIASFLLLVSANWISGKISDNNIW